MTLRDPSDGTIYEPPKKELFGPPEPEEKSDELKRLEKSREWLKQYHGAKHG
jgi:hypothetical protein